MEKLTNNIAEKIGTELNLDKNSIEVIAYGIFAILQTLFSLAITLILGFAFGVLIETIVVSLTISILRKYSGGVHASSPGICAGISSIIAVGLALLSVYITPLISLKLILVLGLASFVWSFYIIYKLCPVDSIAKPIKSQKKKNKMKKASLFILYTYMVIVLLNIIVYFYIDDIRFSTYSLCIYGGIVWQSFTLTHEGHVTIWKIDAFLNKIIVFIRRRK